MALDATAAALLSGDFDAYARHCALPFSLVMDEATTIRSTREELRAGFESFAAELRAQGTRDIRRRVTREIAAGQDMMLLFFETRIVLSDGTEQDPFTSAALFRLEDGTWRAVMSLNPARGRVVPEDQAGLGGEEA